MPLATLPSVLIPKVARREYDRIQVYLEENRIPEAAAAARSLHEALDTRLEDLAGMVARQKGYADLTDEQTKKDFADAFWTELPYALTLQSFADALDARSLAVEDEAQARYLLDRASHDLSQALTDPSTPRSLRLDPYFQKTIDMIERATEALPSENLEERLKATRDAYRAWKDLSREG